MLFVTVFYMFYFLHHTRSVKLVIDGTIDFGPKWDFEYKVKPIELVKQIRNEPRKKIPVKSHILDDNEKSSDVDIEEKEDKATVAADFMNTGYENIARTTMDENYNKAFVSEETDYGVTKLYETHNSVRNKPLFNDPRKIKDDSELITFMTNIYDQALAIFEMDPEGSSAKKLAELKERYQRIFGNFLNETKEHHIKTAMGRKKVILHAIEYSDMFLNRLGKRLKIDLEDTGLKSSNTIAKRFKLKVDELKTMNYEDACTQFVICRIGNEFSDYIDEILTILLEKDSIKIYTAVDALIKVLKNTDFSRIMDAETQKAFKHRLSIVEESSSLDRRLLLTGYKVIINYRNFPFSEDNNEPSAIPLAALLHVIETFNKNLKMTDEKESWDKIKRDLKEWASGDDKNVTKIAQEFVDTVQRGVDTFDENTLNEIKSKLKIFMLTKTEWLNFNKYMMFHEDV